MSNITVVGLGYVGLANSILMSKNHHVIGLDIDIEKINLLKNKISPIVDEKISTYLLSKDNNIIFENYSNKHLIDADIIVICTPTNYEDKSNSFNTGDIEKIINDVLINNKNKPLIVIKSTIPLGFTDYLKTKFDVNNIIFSPEFLREGSALYDNLYPSRIIVGGRTKKALTYGQILKETSLNNPEVLFMSSSEAESVKLFSNTYLAMRVAFFNELDSYAMQNNLNTKNIINGVCMDDRIGHFYNNPSFGYGGYCLPKDTKQLLASYEGIPQQLISAVVSANNTRKIFIANYISDKKPKVVGIYRLIMKKGSDNFRDSSIQGIIKLLHEKKIRVIIYEPLVNDKIFNNVKVQNNLNCFKDDAELIIANRMNSELSDVIDKVFTRDIFGIS